MNYRKRHDRSMGGDDQLGRQESYWILAYAMLNNFMEDLAWARDHGLWVDSPNEMRGDFTFINENIPLGITANDLAIQYNQESTQALMGLIRDCTGNKVKMDQTSLRRGAMQSHALSVKYRESARKSKTHGPRKDSENL